METIVRGLRKKVLRRTFIDVWTDWPKTIMRPKDFGQFRKEIIGRQIENIRRRAKYILFDLSGGKTLLVHQKLTGHLLFGRWRRENNSWKSEIPGSLFEDPRNGFLHVIFFLNNDSEIALSDLRKFAKVELWDSVELKKAKELISLGPEPLSKSFTFKKFKKVLPKKGKIKQVLMDQAVIAGIGNIYSDEILWEAKIHPLSASSKITGPVLKEIYKAIKKVLKRAIGLKGDSFSDFRLITGEKGGYQKIQKVYGQEGKICPRKDGGRIQRLKIGGRSARFCPKCQILYL